jgi:hypothetical protein
MELNGLAPQVSARGIAQLMAQGLVGLRVGEVQAREIAIRTNQSRQGFALGDRGGAVKARADLAVLGMGGTHASERCDGHESTCGKRNNPPTTSHRRPLCFLQIVLLELGSPTNWK